MNECAERLKNLELSVGKEKLNRIVLVQVLERLKEEVERLECENMLLIQTTEGCWKVLFDKLVFLLRVSSYS